MRIKKISESLNVSELVDNRLYFSQDPKGDQL